MRSVHRFAAVISALTLTVAPVRSQREHTRPTPDRSTEVTEQQATEITLTLTDVAFRPIQIWVRAGGALDESGRFVTAAVSPAEAKRVAIGQRARAFSPDTRSRMYQAFVSAVKAGDDRVSLEVRLTSRALEARRHYVVEIVTESEELLSVPNEALIESEGRRLVYVQGENGYFPREVEAGIQGERYTQVLGGLDEGERVVTFGSFFIDAEHKLKGS